VIPVRAVHFLQLANVSGKLEDNILEHQLSKYVYFKTDVGFVVCPYDLFLSLFLSFLALAGFYFYHFVIFLFFVT
jgi:hypothetical protein